MKKEPTGWSSTRLRWNVIIDNEMSHLNFGRPSGRIYSMSQYSVRPDSKTDMKCPANNSSYHFSGLQKEKFINPADWCERY